jgi:RiboL-PSP-HEPN
MWRRDSKPRSGLLRPYEVPLHAIESRKQQLDAYFRRAADTAISDEVRSDLAKHGIVLICGFVERSVETIVMEKISQRAHPRVQKFIRGHFKIGTNYTCEAIAQLLERFDLGWCTQFRAFLRARDDLVEALRSAYDLRNSIAHGGTGTRGLRGVQDLYVAAKQVVDGMEAATT